MCRPLLVRALIKGCLIKEEIAVAKIESGRRTWEGVQLKDLTKFTK